MRNNRCDTCYAQDAGVCPILEIAYKRGLEGMQHCEMAELIDKIVLVEKEKARFGPRRKEQIA